MAHRGGYSLFHIFIDIILCQKVIETHFVLCALCLVGICVFCMDCATGTLIQFRCERTRNRNNPTIYG